MHYLNLGNSGLKISKIVLGMMTYGSSSWRPWVLDKNETKPFIKKALDLGINFFDTADLYSNGVGEEVTGELLNAYINREEVVIGSKVYFPQRSDPNSGGLSRKHIMEAIEASLKRLKTDYIDLYQIHRFDYETPLEETLSALHDLVKSGKVRYIGASSMYAWQFCKAYYIAKLNNWTTFISMQDQYNLITREPEREMLPLCQDLKVGFLAWSPLARGFLSKKQKPTQKEQTRRFKSDPFLHHNYIKEDDYQVSRALNLLAKEKGLTPAHIALAWLFHQSSVTGVIVGATKLTHLEDAVGTLELTLSDEELKPILSLSALSPLRTTGMHNEYRYRFITPG